MLPLRFRLLPLVLLAAPVPSLPLRAADDPRILTPFRSLGEARAGAECTSVVKLADGSLLTADGKRHGAQP